MGFPREYPQPQVAGQRLFFGATFWRFSGNWKHIPLFRSHKSTPSLPNGHYGDMVRMRKVQTILYSCPFLEPLNGLSGREYPYRGVKTNKCLELVFRDHCLQMVRNIFTNLRISKAFVIIMSHESFNESRISEFFLSFFNKGLGVSVSLKFSNSPWVFIITGKEGWCGICLFAPI